MKKSFSILVLLSLFSLSTFVAKSQSRPRRVGQNPPASAPSSSSTNRPPILGGVNSAGKQTGTTKTTQESGPEEVDAGDVIKVDTTLVTLPVSVTDRDGRYIPNLTKSDFRLWEDGVEQQVAFFTSVDKPFSVVLVLDTSGSTRFKIEEIQEAAITFVNQLRSDDRVMIISFDDDIRVLAEFTNDRYRMRDAIRRTRTGNGTRLYDAVDLVINQRLNQVDGRNAVVLFTDGVDTASRHSSYDRNVRDAEELDALIYPVQYDTFRDVGGGGGGGIGWPGSTNPIDIIIDIFGRRTGGSSGGGGGSNRRDYERANRYLRELAEKTGARQYQADNTRNLSYAFRNIAEELRRQYSLGYYPLQPPQNGERRQVRVRVNKPNLAVRSRDSYVFGDGTVNTAQTPVLRRKLTND